MVTVLANFRMSAQAGLFAERPGVHVEDLTPSCFLVSIWESATDDGAVLISMVGRRRTPRPGWRVVVAANPGLGAREGLGCVEGIGDEEGDGAVDLGIVVALHKPSERGHE